MALPAGLAVTADLAVALHGAEAAILAVPAQHLRAFLAGLPGEAPPLVVAAKGVEQRSLLLPLEIVEALRPGRPAAVLSGPNFAHEVAAGLPAAAVVASATPALRERIGDLLATPAFRLYGSDDPIGVQVGGAAKNVIAIAAGAVIGAGLGRECQGGAGDARAWRSCRGWRWRSAAGRRRRPGLSGLGDLLLTATRPGQPQHLARHGARARAEPRRGAGGKGRRDRGRGDRAGHGRRGPRRPGWNCRSAHAVADLLAGDLTVAEAMGRLLARPRRDE